MTPLILHVRQKYFDQIRAGTKTEEFREDTPYWQKRLMFQAYDRVLICCGYPAMSDPEKVLSFPYRGYGKRYIRHPHFGDRYVSVFAIKLQGD